MGCMYVAPKHEDHTTPWREPGIYVLRIPRRMKREHGRVGNDAAISLHCYLPFAKSKPDPKEIAQRYELSTLWPLRFNWRPSPSAARQ